MIHNPLLNIDRLRAKAERGDQLTTKEWQSIRDDMNCAVCFFLRLQDRNAFVGHANIEKEIKLFLNSRDEISSANVKECICCGGGVLAWIARVA